MIKKWCFITIIIYLCCQILAVPASFAESANTKLSFYTKQAKKLFNIGEGLTEFNFHIHSQNESSSLLSLEWRNPSQDSFESVTVTFNSSRNVVYYEHTLPIFLDKENKNRIPKITQEAAFLLARKFIKKVSPDIKDNLSSDENTIITYTSGVYSFLFSRLNGGIPVQGEGVVLEMNSSTGEVLTFKRQFTPYIFLGAKPVISAKTAQQKFIDTFGFNLYYGVDDSTQNSKIFPVYASVYSSIYSVDAISGELLKIPLASPFTPFGNYSPQSWTGENSSTLNSNNTFDAIQIDALDNTTKKSLIEVQTAEITIRAASYLNLDDSYFREKVSLNKYSDQHNKYFWMFRFSKNTTSTPMTVQVNIDAQTGEPFSFRKFLSLDALGIGSTLISSEAGKKYAQEFLKSYFPEKYSSTNYFPIMQPDILINRGAYPYTAYSFYRVKDGIPYFANFIKLEVNLQTGEIVSMEQTWDRVKKFLPPSTFVSESDIAPKIFRSMIPNLAYLNFSTDKNSSTPNYRLAYYFDSSRTIFNGATGKQLKASAQKTKYEYWDIENHYAKKQIRELGLYGIGLDKAELEPDMPILQKELYLMLYQITNNETQTSMVDYAKDKDKIIKYLVSANIIKQDEYAPNALITRENAVKILVRLLNLDKLASLDKIFKYPFNDEIYASKDAIGSISIASGLNLIKGDPNGNFYPNQVLTRAQAMVVFYNYLRSI